MGHSLPARFRVVWGPLPRSGQKVFTIAPANFSAAVMAIRQARGLGLDSLPQSVRCSLPGPPRHIVGGFEVLFVLLLPIFTGARAL